MSVTDWLSHETTFTYYVDGNLTQTAYPNGDAVTSTYDATDALMTTSVAGVVPRFSITYTRNADGLYHIGVPEGRHHRFDRVCL